MVLTEGLNKGYNYLLKIAIEGDADKFQSEIEIEIEYAPSTQLINKLVPIQSPINHIVFLPFKDTCKNVEINKSFELLTHLFNELPDISSFAYGKCQKTSSDKNYVFEIIFSDEANRDNYLTDE